MNRTCPQCRNDYETTASRQIHCSLSCAAKATRSRVSVAGADNPNWRGGKTTHPLYERYLDMIARCTNPTHARYRDYGGRGIEVCEGWRNDFWAYARDLGDPPQDGQRWTVDRIDNDGSYCPGNVRWATYRQQTRNRRTVRRTAPGHPKLDRTRPWQVVLAAFYGRSASEIGNHFGVSRRTVANILSGRHSLL